jgi:hypothetical protein
MTPEKAEELLREGTIANFTVDEHGVVHVKSIEDGNWTPAFPPKQ